MISSLHNSVVCLGFTWGLLGDSLGIAWGHIIHGDPLRFWSRFAFRVWGKWIHLLEDVDFGTFVARGFAWGDFAWGCEAGVSLHLQHQNIEAAPMFQNVHTPQQAQGIHAVPQILRIEVAHTTPEQ